LSKYQLSLDPKSPAPVQVYTKKAVALSQLETAIMLWFNYGDPISILHLAGSSNDCYVALGGHAGHKSFYQEWFKTQSKTFQKRMLYIQSWIKHGLKQTNRPLRYSPIQAEALMIDSMDCHSHLTGKMTTFMRLFLIRFAFENPNIVVPEARGHFLKGIEYNILDIDRQQFLQYCLQRLGNTA
jgi:hypothetical protein